MSVTIPNNVINMKKVDGIIVTVTGYTYNPGSKTLKRRMSDEQYIDFQIYMAKTLAEEFIRSIDNQRYAMKGWPPLSLGYYTWKKRHKLSLNIWEATGHLKSEIKVFKKGNFIAVGFKQSDLYPKSFAKVNDVARFVEYGTTKMPPRPLFRTLLVYMRKNVSRFYKKYEKEVSKSKTGYLFIKPKKKRGRK